MDAPITNPTEETAVVQRLQPKWQGIAKDIAEEFSCSLSEVEQMLSTETYQLEQGARIKDFVSVLAIREVKDLLRLNRRTPPDTRSAI